MMPLLSIMPRPVLVIALVMENVHFMESFPSVTNKSFIIAADGVVGRNVVVDGPMVCWAQGQRPSTGLVWAAASGADRAARERNDTATNGVSWLEDRP